MSNCDVALFVWNRISVAGTQVFGDGAYMYVFYFNFYFIYFFIFD